MTSQIQGYNPMNEPDRQEEEGDRGIVLCVDDDVNVLRSLRRTLLPHASDVLLAEDSVEALQVIQGHPVDVVICDMGLPDNDGYKTLQAIRKQRPEITRLVLSADTRKETILKLVLDGTASIYLHKPWNADELIRLVLHLIKIRRILQGKGMQRVLQQVTGLPTVQNRYQEVMRRISNDRPTSEIAALIEQDPAYSAMVLRVANSAINGVPIGSIRQAIVYLGLMTIKNIILGCEIFSETAGTRDGLCSFKSLWIHSNLCNAAFSALFRRFYKKNVCDELASVGLLHDVGRLVMMKHFSSSCKDVEAELKKNPENGLCEAEQRIIGVSHAELGAMILDMWNLPSQIIEACLFHHDPTNEKVFHREYVGLLRIADYMAWKAQGGIDTKPTPQELAIVGASEDILEDPLICSQLKVEDFDWV